MTSTALKSILNVLLINTCHGAKIENFSDVNTLISGIEERFFYVNNDRMKKIRTSLYAHLSKVCNRVILITRVVLCHIAKIYEISFSAFQILIQDFRIPSTLQFLKKTVVLLLFKDDTQIVKKNRTVNFCTY